MHSGSEKIRNNINSFRRRYYLNTFLRGSLLTLTVLVLYFLLAALLEYALWLDPWIRFVIFLSFILTASYCVYRFLREPLRFWIGKIGIGDEQSARLIGSHFPQIRDRLVNLIQLFKIKDTSALAYASIDQKTKTFEAYQFDSVIDFGENKKYLKYLSVPLGIILLLVLLNKSVLTQSTYRIVNFNQEFTPQAPFSFSIQNKSLIGFYNEDYVLSLSLVGNAIPDACYIILGSQRMKMENVNAGSFSYTFETFLREKKKQVQVAL